MATRARATIDDLYLVKSKAELVGGEIVHMSPTGFLPGRAAGAIYASLREYERRTKSGFALGDNIGFVVDLANRQSFSPDAAYHVGQSTGMKFLDGAPIFAAEVRSENKYGPRKENRMGQKRSDYFAAGTQVVWDVDLQGEDVIKVYRATDPQTPTVYRRGDTAEAEPALPGWQFGVNELFE
jgi:Uma2 family endonuclease